MNKRRIAGHAMQMLGTRITADERAAEEVPEAIVEPPTEREVDERTAAFEHLLGSEIDEVFEARGGFGAGTGDSHHSPELMSELADLDAVASEQGAVLALQICGNGELEPALMRIAGADAGTEKSALLIEILDRNGSELGRYVVPTNRLERALDDAEADAATDPVAADL